MKKKSSRRVTLSSADLESFLSEVNQTENPSSRRKTIISSENNNDFNTVNLENIDPNVTNTSKSSSKSGKEANKVILTSCTIDSSTGPKSNEQKVRDFCKVMLLFNDIYYIFLSLMVYLAISFAVI